MAYAIFYCDTKLKLKRNPRGQRITNHIFGVLAIFGYNALIPDLPTGLYMRRNFIQIEHPFIPTDHVRLQFPFPNPNAPGFIGEGNAFHQPFVNPLGMLQVVNVLNLRDKVEWSVVAMTHQRNGQQRPDDVARAGVIAFFHGIAINLSACQHVELFKVVVQIFRPG